MVPAALRWRAEADGRDRSLIFAPRADSGIDMIELQIQYRALAMGQAADSHQGATSIQIIAVAHPSNQMIDTQNRKSFRLKKGDAGGFLFGC